MSKNNKILDKLAVFSRKLAGYPSVKSIQEGFSATIPLLMLSSVATLVDAIFATDGIVSGLFTEEILSSIRTIAASITNGTNNILSIAIAVAISYYYAKNKNFKDTIGCVINSLTIMVIFMPLSVSATIGETTGEISGVLSYTYTATNGILPAMLIGILGTGMFIHISNNEHLQIKMPAGVPEATSNAFNILFPTIITGVVMALVAYIFRLFGTNMYQFILTVVQTPLQGLVTGLPGFMLVYTIALFSFTLGIHVSVINSVCLKPFLAAAFNENALALAAGEAAPNIINRAFFIHYQGIGGAGCVLALVIATFIVAKKKRNREMAKIGAIPALFNIGEPMIFGMPVMLNPILIIPFVVAPLVCILIAYAATAVGFIEPTSVFIPFVTPTLISGFLGHAGDIKASIVQLVCLIVSIVIYIPFVKLYDRSLPDEEE